MSATGRCVLLVAIGVLAPACHLIAGLQGAVFDEEAGVGGTGADGGGGANGGNGNSTGQGGMGGGNGGEGGGCTGALSLCGELCVDTKADPDHCGGCNVPCEDGERSQGVCVAGICDLECTEGFADCDGLPGCETNVVGNPLNCGECGNACGIECADTTCNDVVDVQAGERFACALRADGSVWCWGADFWGNLGSGLVNGPNSAVPVQVSLGQAAKQLSVSVLDARQHACALMQDDTVRCWGANSNGQCGIGSANPSQSPAPALGLSNVVQVEAGGTFSCAITAAQELYCWGANAGYQTGLGTTSGNTISPTLVIGGASEIGLGTDHGCMRSGGNISCWGNNNHGQLGKNNTLESTTPTTISLGLGNAAAIVIGGESRTCVTFTDTSLNCWGRNDSNQLGVSPADDLLVPTPVGAGTLDGADSVARGAGSFQYGHGGAVVGGQVYLWGRNSAGEVNPAAPGAPVADPMNVSNSIGLPPASQVTTGGGFTCVLLESGKVTCWGANNYGQVGMGAFAPDPVASPTDVSWTVVSAAELP